MFLFLQNDSVSNCQDGTDGLVPMACSKLTFHFITLIWGTNSDGLSKMKLDR